MTTDTTRKSGERPAHVKPPEHLTKSPPVPKPDSKDKADKITDDKGPTRYGDWELNGIAIDF